MSGGFFRGTSADQDTRFSNKQAKLLKSQKFAPELELPVDMTKVKMDVMRPWIATRVTELIGFEDEVLINFIYGLLDGKGVNGKEVQISLTGFMERNTGKFMKELWSLLLSAQKNASGVPQQFLDAKEEETKKKKAESDRIAIEIRRKKEKESQELEQERTKKMDRGNDILKDVDAGGQPGAKHQPRARSVEEKESEERNGLRGRSRERRSRSISKSFSNSRSYSDERRKSRSLSASPRQRGRSSSSEMVHRSSPRRSLTPHRSPQPSFTPRRRSSYSRRRSSSGPRHRSPSPIRYRVRSPLRHRSRSPLRRGSRLPIWRRPRSPTRRSSPRDRSQSPLRHLSSSVRRRSPSPIRRNSPSPMRYGSPSLMRRKYRRSPSTPRRRSPPIRRRSRSPIQRRSRSPIRRRSRSPIRRRSPSPVRHMSPSPIRRKSPIMVRIRSPTPANDKSPSHEVLSSPSPIRRKSPLESHRGRIRSHEKSSPVRHAAPRNTVEHPTNARQRSNSSERQSQSVSWGRNDSHRKVKRSSPSPRKSLVSEAERETSLSEKRSEGAKRKNDSSAKIPSSNQQADLHGEGHPKGHLSPERLHGHQPVQTHSQPDMIELNKREKMLQRENKSEKIGHQKKAGQQDPQMISDTFRSETGTESPVGERHRAVEKNQSYLSDIKINDRHLEAASKLSRKVEHNVQSASLGSDSEESDKSRAKAKDRRKKKRAERRGSESSDESSYDSYAEERKEAKRRRKEEKRLKKEDRRRRREERRRRKEERRAEKQKLKLKDAVSSPSDTRNHDGYSDDQSVKKKLETELRERALESLRAKKKGIGY
ncbi:hypothetical protein ACH5RR_020736 [Cinchona calisaya]|uniref:PWI domain-containing protein n=1 Tax=Cinchona calisaya TaxID=153742 RepID=A0ABD2ZJ56_9GENT